MVCQVDQDKEIAPPVYLSMYLQAQDYAKVSNNFAPKSQDASNSLIRSLCIRIYATPLPNVQYTPVRLAIQDSTSVIITNMIPGPNSWSKRRASNNNELTMVLLCHFGLHYLFNQLVVNTRIPWYILQFSVQTIQWIQILALGYAL